MAELPGRKVGWICLHVVISLCTVNVDRDSNVARVTRSDASGPMKQPTCRIWKVSAQPPISMRGDHRRGMGELGISFGEIVTRTAGA